MVIVSSLFRLPSPLVFVGISLFSLLWKCSLEPYICVNVWAWSHKTAFSNVYSISQAVQKSNEVQRHERTRVNPTVNSPFPQLSNSKAFQYVILKQSCKTETKQVLYTSVETRCKTSQCRYTVQVQPWLYKIWQAWACLVRRPVLCRLTIS